MSAEGHMVKYSSFDLDEVEELDGEMQKSGSGEWMKLLVGKNIIRILPGLPGQKTFRLVHEHQLNLPNGEFRNFACPLRMAKKSCLVCRKADSLKASGNPANYDRAKGLFSRKRIYANVIDRKDEATGPKVLAFGVKIWTALKDIRDDEDFGGDFTHPDTGFDIVIKRSGTGKMDTEYTCKPKSKSPLGNMDWVEQQQSLDRFAFVPSEKQIREKLSGGNDRGYDEDDDASPKGTIVDASLDDDDVPF